MTARAPITLTRQPLLVRHGGVALLTLMTGLVHGYHPFAEDGGLYIAGVEWLLKPSLFPHDRAFVTAHLRYSIFAPVLAFSVRVTHMPLGWMLCICFFATAWLFLYAFFRLAHVLLNDDVSALLACVLGAAWFALPVAGTSLLMMDPYVTARSFSTPLSLLAIALLAEALAGSELRRQVHLILCATVSLLLAGAFHPLMAGYAGALCLFMVTFRYLHRRALIAGVGGLCLATVAICMTVQHGASPETPAQLAAVLSRYYWFLSQWQWYELAGVLAPLALVSLPLVLRSGWMSVRANFVFAATLTLSALALLLCIGFTRESLNVHAVARLQPLRVFVMTYALLAVLLGSLGARWAIEAWRRNRRIPAAIFAACAVALLLTMFGVSRATYPLSAQIEFPGVSPRNPWAQAFLWVRAHTEEDALVALDARYVNRQGEDAQNFRALSQRSELPDFSKDGGEAAITPPLATAWLTGATAQRDFDALSDAERDRRLHLLGVNWMVLRAETPTQHPCPYVNAVAKVCALR